MIARKKLGEILVEGGLLNQKQLEQALPFQKKSGLKLGQFLVREGIVSESQIVDLVRPIVDDIAERGAVAALEYGEKFDGVRPDTVRVPVAAYDRYCRAPSARPIRNRFTAHTSPSTGAPSKAANGSRMTARNTRAVSSIAAAVSIPLFQRQSTSTRGV